MRIVFTGFILAVLANIPFYAWIFAKDWQWFQGFPFGWISAGMVYMATFFHEIGHTLLLWFYGYPTVPMFDFKHGGGLALMLSDQQVLIVLIVWALLGYFIWAWRDYRVPQIILICLLLVNLCTVFTPYHMVVANFMGPGAECLVAGFFLIRALLDLAPRGAFERFLNAFFGFGIILQVFVNAYGLLNSGAYRLVYYEQKGTHGFGDFDKIARDIPDAGFNHVVWFWLALNCFCLVAPFFLFMIKRYVHE